MRLDWKILHVIPQALHLLPARECEKPGQVAYFSENQPIGQLGLWFICLADCHRRSPWLINFVLRSDMQSSSEDEETTGRIPCILKVMWSIDKKIKTR